MIYPLALAGGCLAAVADWPGLPSIAPDASGLWQCAARLASGIAGFAIYFAIAPLTLRASAGHSTAPGMPDAAPQGVHRRIFARTAMAAFVFAAAFLALSLNWLYDGSIEFFGNGAIARAITAIAVSIYLCVLAAPFVITSVAAGLIETVCAARTGRTARCVGAFARCAAPVLLIVSIDAGHDAAFGFAWFEFGQWLLDLPGTAPVLRGLGAKWSGLVPLGLAGAAAPLIFVLSSIPGRSAAPPTEHDPAAPPSPPPVDRSVAPGPVFKLAHGVPLIAWLLFCAFAWFGASPAAAAGDPGETADLHVALIAGVPADRGYSPRERVAAYLAETLRFIESRPAKAPIDLILWPESIADENLAAARGVILKRLTDAGIRADLWIGARAPGPGNRSYNAMHALRANRVLYRKRRLVPFTERLPAPESFFRWLTVDFLQLQPRTRELLIAGAPDDPDYHSFHWPAGGAPAIRVLTLICYETAFADLLARPAGEPAAGLILNPGNESWFQSELLKRYTLRQARTRALESGLPLVRIVSDGYSAAIDGDGRVARLLRDASGIVKISPATSSTAAHDQRPRRERETVALEASTGGERVESASSSPRVRSGE